MSDNKPTQPISIPARRRRSFSFSSSGSDSPPPQTPVTQSPPKLQSAPAVSPPSSPILSYFFASPPKTASSVTAITPGSLGSFGRSFAAKQPSTDVVVEEDEDHDADFEPLLVRHARRLSTGWQTAPRLAQPPSVTDTQNDRGTALLRRLSLGSAIVRPQVSNVTNVKPPPPTPATVAPPSPPRAKTPPSNPSPGFRGRRTRRSATISGDARTRRAPSPMGERILRGQFDGFN